MLGPGGTAQLPNPAPGRLWTEPLLVGFMVEHLEPQQYINISNRNIATAKYNQLSFLQPQGPTPSL